MVQILLYTLSNLFDSKNLIKLIWPRIGGDLEVGLNNSVLATFCVKTCTSVNVFVFLASFPVMFQKNFFL